MIPKFARRREARRYALGCGLVLGVLLVAVPVGAENPSRPFPMKFTVMVEINDNPHVKDFPDVETCDLSVSQDMSCVFVSKFKADQTLHGFVAHRIRIARHAHDETAVSITTDLFEKPHDGVTWTQIRDGITINGVTFIHAAWSPPASPKK